MRIRRLARLLLVSSLRSTPSAASTWYVLFLNRGSVELCTCSRGWPTQAVNGRQCRLGAFRSNGCHYGAAEM